MMKLSNTLEAPKVAPKGMFRVLRVEPAAPLGVVWWVEGDHDSLAEAVDAAAQLYSAVSLSHGGRDVPFSFYVFDDAGRFLHSEPHDPARPDAVPEDVETLSPEVAEYWTDLYGRLVDIEERAVERALAEAERLGPEAAQVIRSTTVDPLQDLVESFRERHRFWSERLRELKGR